MGNRHGPLFPVRHHPLSEHSENIADLVMSFEGLPHGTLGSLIPPDVHYSPAMLDFVNWSVPLASWWWTCSDDRRTLRCLMADPVPRAHSYQLLNDDWFMEQLGGKGINQVSVAGGISHCPRRFKLLHDRMCSIIRWTW
jgi:hypothetical protein